MLLFFGFVTIMVIIVAVASTKRELKLQSGLLFATIVAMLSLLGWMVAHAISDGPPASNKLVVWSFLISLGVAVVLSLLWVKTMLNLPMKVRASVKVIQLPEQNLQQDKEYQLRRIRRVMYGPPPR